MDANQRARELQMDWMRLRTSLQAWCDWKQHVRAHPHLTLALGVATGVFIIRRPLAFGALAMASGRTLIGMLGRGALVAAIRGIQKNQ